jgi:hypothetical protein
MAKKKRREIQNRSKTKKKKAARKTKVAAAAKRPKRQNLSGKKVRSAAKNKRVRPAAKKKKRSPRPGSGEIRSPEPSTLAGTTFSTGGRPSRSGTGSRAGGQSGDVQALSRQAVVDSESVEELLEEGQALEAAAISGVEDALDPDQGELQTREVPEDDVPEEYLDED